MTVNLKQFIYPSASADPLPNSPGAEKMRFDLSCFLDDKKGGRLDLVQHLFVAVEKNLSNKKPRGGLRGTVVELKKGDEIQYVVLNTKSLVKRLGISKQQLSQAKGDKGSIDSNFIKETLKKIQKDQESINNLIKSSKEAKKDKKAKPLKFVNKQIPDKKVRKLVKSLIDGDEIDKASLKKKLWWGNSGGKKCFEKISIRKLPKSYYIQAERLQDQKAPMLNFLPTEKNKKKYTIEVYNDFLYREKPAKKKGYIAYRVGDYSQKAAKKPAERPYYWALLKKKSLQESALKLKKKDLKNAEKNNDCTSFINTDLYHIQLGKEIDQLNLIGYFAQIKINRGQVRKTV